MATKSTPNNSTPNPTPEEYEAFPEPRGWTMAWDGAALQGLSKPPSTPPKPKRP